MSHVRRIAPGMTFQRAQGRETTYDRTQTAQPHTATETA